MTERGRIRSAARALVERDFSGLRWGKITPTDIDGFIEFGDRLFVFVESKFNGAALPHGQRLALERLCDACHQPPRRIAAVIIADQMEQSDLVDYAKLRVRAYRYGGTWRNPLRADMTCKEAIDRLYAMSNRAQIRRVK
jgi:hypothetical protein